IHLDGDGGGAGLTPAGELRRADSLMTTLAEAAAETHRRELGGNALLLLHHANPPANPLRVNAIHAKTTRSRPSSVLQFFTLLYKLYRRSPAAERVRSYTSFNNSTKARTATMSQSSGSDTMPILSGSDTVSVSFGSSPSTSPWASPLTSPHSSGSEPMSISSGPSPPSSPSPRSPEYSPSESRWPGRNPNSSLPNWSPRSTSSESTLPDWDSESTLVDWSPRSTSSESTLPDWDSESTLVDWSPRSTSSESTLPVWDQESTLPDWSPRSTSSESTLPVWDPDSTLPDWSPRSMSSESTLPVWDLESTLSDRSPSSTSTESTLPDWNPESPSSEFTLPAPQNTSTEFTLPALWTAQSTFSGFTSPEPWGPETMFAAFASPSPASRAPVFSFPGPSPPGPSFPAYKLPPLPARLVIAIAGPTSSGKTTLSNLLLHVFGNGGAAPESGFTAAAIHQDDFLVPNRLPSGPQIQWVECYLEEWMDERLVTRTSMQKGFTVAEADKITPVHEEQLIKEFRDLHPRTLDAPNFDSEFLSLQIRSGKNRDTRIVIDTFKLDIAIARARASELSDDLPEYKRDEIEDYGPPLKKSRLAGPEIRVKNEKSLDSSSPIKNEELVKKEELDMEYLLIKQGELTLKERSDLGIFSPYILDPTMKVPQSEKGKRGYMNLPIKPNSLPPHHSHEYTPSSLQYPELPEGTRELLSFIMKLRADVQHWIDAMWELNVDAGFPGLNVIKGKFRGLFFVEGFTILDSAVIDPFTEPRNYDLSLFLSATREGTRKRRFARPEYNKPIKKEYMTWRERSYFDGVAWPAFIEEHKWIFNVTPEEAKNGLMPDAKCGNVSKLAQDRGILVRPGELEIKQTLQWAVNTMMDEFEKKEKNAREKWVDLQYGYEDVSRYGEGIQEPFMNENDLNIMFAVEKAKVDMTELVDLECREDAERENVESWWGRHEGFENEDGDGDGHPWLGMHEEDFVDKFNFGDWLNDEDEDDKE
ncbi:hypothetical protein V502_00197, partial [Pseudogymnoascus sp. VKM F-4520 (FW-2644)]